MRPPILHSLNMNGNDIQYHMSRRMGKPTICIGKNKGTDQLRSNCEADQRLCFRYSNSTIPLLVKSKICSLLPSSVTVQPGLCQTWSEPKLLVFSCTGSLCHLWYTYQRHVILSLYEINIILHSKSKVNKHLF